MNLFLSEKKNDRARREAWEGNLSSHSLRLYSAKTQLWSAESEREPDAVTRSVNLDRSLPVLTQGRHFHRRRRGVRHWRTYAFSPASKRERGLNFFLRSSITFSFLFLVRVKGIFGLTYNVDLWERKSVNGPPGQWTPGHNTFRLSSHGDQSWIILVWRFFLILPRNWTELYSTVSLTYSSLQDERPNCFKLNTEYLMDWDDHRKTLIGASLRGFDYSSLGSP